MTEQKMKQETKTEKEQIKVAGAKCADPHCPFHGCLSTHGREFIGKVVSDKMAKTVSVAWDRTVYIPKYERYEKKRSKVKAHVPECISIKTGDAVRIVQCRPISKTKHFVVMERL